MGNTAKAFNDALSALRGGDLTTAETLFRRVVQAENSNVAALNLLVVALMSLERFAEAEPFIARATSINQNSDVSFYNYGLISKRLNKPQQALEQFTKALELNSNVPETWNNRGTIFNDLKQYELALADFDRAISLNLRYGEAYANKATSLTLLKRHDEAVAAYDKALSIKPDLAEAWLGRGHVFNDIERFDEAFAAYDKALSINPGLTEASFQKAKILDFEYQRARKLAFDKRYDDAETAYQSFYSKYRNQQILPDLSKIAAQKKAIFVGCARDCAQNVQGALANIANVASLFRDSSFLLVENDSSDATPDLILRWCSQRASARLVNLDGLSDSCKARTMRIAAARNAYLDIVRSEFREYDYLFVLDLDDASVTPLETNEVLRAVEYCETNSACAAVFPIQRYYYDSYALRQKTLCPADIFEEAFDKACSQQRDASQIAREFLGPRIFEIYDAIGRAKEPMEVESAFGGLGIYKISSLIKNRRRYLGHKHKILPPGVRRRLGFSENGEVGWQVCEHVEFHRGFIENAEKLFLLPWFKNADTAPLSIEYIERNGASFIDGKAFLLPDKASQAPE
jgi:tetratricopeptide (TPR) repeat protein